MTVGVDGSCVICVLRKVLIGGLFPLMRIRQRLSGELAYGVLLKLPALFSGSIRSLGAKKGQLAARDSTNSIIIMHIFFHMLIVSM